MANIVIIGGGVSGLSAGIYAQLNGHHAIVCEKHASVGGNLTGWQRGAYHIDNCIHWLTGTNSATTTYSMWQELGALGNVEIFQGDTLYTCYDRGKTLSLNRNLYQTEQDMLAISPQDRKEIRSLIRAVEVMQGICGIGCRTHREPLIRTQAFWHAPALLKYYRLSTGELAARFSHPLLRFFISAFWGDAFGALALLMVFAHFCGENGGIPVGGSCAMAQRMSERLVSLGGELLCRKEAVKIRQAQGKARSVIFADGSELPADYVVLTADPAVMFPKLLDISMPNNWCRRYQNARFRRFSACQCAFACDLPNVPFQGDFIFAVPAKYRAMCPSEQVIVREFSHEERFAPKGKTVLQTILFCDEESAKAWIALRQTDREAYRKKKERLSDVFLHLLTQQFPQMRGKLQCIDVWTPATYCRYTESEVGSFMSFALPERMLPIRMSNRIPGLSNVILATQWQQSPGGLPIAAEGGKKAIETIVRQERKHSVPLPNESPKTVYAQGRS